MDRLKIRHLAVRHEDGRLAGIVSARDPAETARECGDQSRRHDRARRLAAEMARPGRCCPPSPCADRRTDRRARNRRNRQRGALRHDPPRRDLAEAAMTEEGLGPPPCAYAVLVLGSGGRGESLLAADQDNAIVFAEGDPDGPADRWFARLGEKIADLLDQSGVPYCKGGVMARNADWRGSSPTGRSAPTGSAARGRGSAQCRHLLRSEAGAWRSRARRGAFRPCLRVAATGRPSPSCSASRSPPESVHAVRRPPVEGGRIDLKLHGLFPVVTARAHWRFATASARSTRGRLEGLIGLDIGGDEDMPTHVGPRVSGADARPAKPRPLCRASGIQPGRATRAARGRRNLRRRSRRCSPCRPRPRPDVR